MTSPVPDDLRTQLAEVARSFIVAEVGEDMGEGMTDQAERFADALLPFLARARAEGAAEALREAAEEVHVARFNADEDPDARWPVGSPQKVDSFYAGCVFTRNRLRDRAAALSAPTTTEGDPT